MDGCADEYHCVTVLYLLSMWTNVYNIKIDHGVGAQEDKIPFRRTP